MIYNYTFKNDKRMAPFGTIRIKNLLILKDNFFC